MITDAGIVGRESEIQALDAVRDRIVHGRCEALLITGESGIGKSSLAETILARPPFRGVTGKAFEHVRPAYGPLLSIARACREFNPQGHGALTDRLAQSVTSGAGPTAIADGLSEILADCAHTAPLAIIADDLQWADEGTLDVLPVLVDMLRHEPVLVAATIGEPQASTQANIRRLRQELRRLRRVTVLKLAPLDLTATRALLAARLDSPVAASLATQVHSHTEGHPLYIEELGVALEQHGRLRQGRHGLELDRKGDLPLPESLRDIAALRMEGLEPVAREAIETLAIAGTPLTPAQLSAIVGPELDTAPLVKSGLAVHTEPGSLTLRHALMAEVVRESIPHLRLRSLARRAGELFEAESAAPEIVANLWEHAGDAKRARAAYMSAATDRMRMHAHADTARLLKKALDLWPDDEHDADHFKTMERMAQCAQAAGHYDEAIAAWRNAAEHPHCDQSPGCRAVALRALGTVLQLRGEREQALSAHAASIAAFEQSQRPDEAIEQSLAFAEMLIGASRLGDAGDVLQRAADGAREGGWHDLHARALGLLAYLLSTRGRYDEADRIARAALTLALEHGRTDTAGYVYRHVAGVAEFASDFAGAQNAYSRALVYCREHDIPKQARLCMGCMSYVLFRAGAWNEALTLSDEILADPHSPLISRASGALTRAMIHTLRGESRAAKRDEARAVAWGDETGVAVLTVLNAWLAATRALRTAPDDAHRRFIVLLDAWHKTEDRHDVLPGLCAATRFFARHGDLHRAHQCSGILAAIAAAGNPEALGAHAYAAGTIALAEDRPEDALGPLADSVSAFERSGTPLERLHALWEWGTATVRVGECEAGIERVRESYRIARSLVMRPAMEAIAASLREFGADSEPRTSRDATGGAAALTRRQRDVATLIAQGLTNREIADKLCVSTRTVDMHVRDILARLDCRTRAEVAGKLAAADS